MPEVKTLRINIFGVREVEAKLFQGELAVGNMRPVLENVADDMMAIIGLNFSSQGRRGGGSWRRNTEEVTARKIKEGLSPLILVATGRLHDSMTQRDDPDQDLRVTNQSISLSSNLKYAEGSSWSDDLNYTKILPTDVTKWVRMCEEHLRLAMGF